LKYVIFCDKKNREIIIETEIEADEMFCPLCSQLHKRTSQDFYLRKESQASEKAKKVIDELSEKYEQNDNKT
jgi:DNA-directed RNA polymerase subunit M/transcription elongation factor TFIIS